MIEIARARSGAEIIKRSGRSLSSPYDPIREGESWAERACAALPSDAGAFVLGLGSGYAAAALQSRIGVDRIVILEPDAGVAAQSRGLALRASGVLARLSFECVVSGLSPENAIDAPASQALLARRIRVFAFGPAADAQVDWHRCALALLIAREPQAFRRALLHRKELAAALDPVGVEALNELASITSVSRLIKADATGRDVAIWRALAELVV